jgi:hypothetical protein
LADPRAVEDRQRHGGRAGVELAQVQDGVLVLRRRTGVGRDLAGLPLALGRRRIVERDVLDGVFAHLPAGALDEVLCRRVEAGELDLAFAILPPIDGPYATLDLIADP